MFQKDEIILPAPGSPNININSLDFSKYFWNTFFDALAPIIAPIVGMRSKKTYSLGLFRDIAMALNQRQSDKLKILSKSRSIL